MRTVQLTVALAVVALMIGSAAYADYGEYFWVVAGHDVAGTGVAQAGVTPYLSAEDWIVGTPAYRGNGGPDAVRKLPSGRPAPLGKTPTERTGNVRVTLAGLERLGVQTQFSPVGRMASVTASGKTMVFLPGSRAAVIDGKLVTMADAPAMRAGKLYVPLKDVATNLLGISARDAISRINNPIAK